MATPLPIFLAELTVSVAVFEPVMTRITAKAGDAIEAHAKKHVAFLTGSLMRSIKSHGAKKGLDGITVKITAGGPSSPHDVGYAGFIEEGTSKMAPQPYMRPALNKVKPQWEKEVADVTALLAAGRPGRVSGSIRR